jgi:uncharacterized protein YhhL (DUF1145 family)
METDVIRLHASAVSRVLGFTAAVLILTSTVGELVRFWVGPEFSYGLNFFYVDREQNIPTIFSILILLYATLLLAVISVLKKRQADNDAAKWTILAFGFLAMSVDEGLAIHEMTVMPIRKFLGEEPHGIFYFSWVIPGIAAVIVLGLFFLPFLLRLPAETKRAFILAALLFIGGALGLELAGGRYAELHGQETLGYVVLATVEEGLEMAGVIVFIHALLRYLANQYPEVRFRFDDPAGSSRKR